MRPPPYIVRDSKVPDWLAIFVKPAAVTIWPFIFLAKGVRGDPELINHESIHIRQYNETLILGFLLMYLWDWLIGLLLYRDARKAYRRIRFEQEAYEHAA